MRQIIAISSVSRGYEIVYAACDDGTFWSYERGVWYQKESIPQDEQPKSAIKIAFEKQMERKD